MSPASQFCISQLRPPDPRPVFVLALFLWPRQWSVATAELLVLTQLKCITQTVVPASYLAPGAVCSRVTSEANADLCVHFLSRTHMQGLSVWHCENEPLENIKFPVFTASLRPAVHHKMKGMINAWPKMCSYIERHTWHLKRCWRFLINRVIRLFLSELSSVSWLCMSFLGPVCCSYIAVNNWPTANVS